MPETEVIVKGMAIKENTSHRNLELPASFFRHFPSYFSLILCLLLRENR